MSKIIEKAFDATKKIIRSIFLGSPNLITSSDLNRQIEAFKYQLDQLDLKTGVSSDLDVAASLSSGTLTVNCEFSYIEVRGCSFSPAKSSLTTNFTSGSPVAYLLLIAEESTVTYEDDFSHEISGAKFLDGTSYPAANQLVYKNERLQLSHNSDEEGVVAILAIFELTESGNVISRKNTIPRKDSLSLNKSGSILNYQSGAKGTISAGTTYDEAFSILESRENNITPNWTTFGEGIGVGYHYKYRVLNRFLQISMHPPGIVFGKNTKKYTVDIVDFPNDVVELFKGLNFDPVSDGNPLFISTNSTNYQEYFIPYQELGSFLIAVKEEKLESSTAYGRFGIFHLCVILYYKPDYELHRVSIGGYFDRIASVESGVLNSSSNNPIGHPLTFFGFKDAIIQIPSIFASIPVPGIV